MQVGQVRGDTHLAQEALGAERRTQRAVEHLERHRAVVVHVAREVDRHGRAAPELAPWDVPGRERPCQPLTGGQRVPASGHAADDIPS